MTDKNAAHMIDLNAEQKKTLLRAVSLGYIEAKNLRDIYDNSLQSMSEEELDRRLDELDRQLDYCHSKQQRGSCPYKRNYKGTLPRLTAADIAEAALISGCDIAEVVDNYNSKAAARKHAKRHPELFA